MFASDVENYGHSSVSCCFNNRLSQVGLFVKADFSEREIFAVEQTLGGRTISTKLASVHEKVGGVSFCVLKKNLFGHSGYFSASYLNLYIEPNHLIYFAGVKCLYGVLNSATYCII